jgi:hypothetical protein
MSGEWQRQLLISGLDGCNLGAFMLALPDGIQQCIEGMDGPFERWAAGYTAAGYHSSAVGCSAPTATGRSATTGAA